MNVTSRQKGPEIMSIDEKRAFAEITPQMPWLYDAILREIDKIQSRITSILDVACGSGHLLRQIQQKYPHLQLKGIDIDPFFVDLASANNPSIQFEVKNATKLQEGADVIISNLSLHHFDNPQEVVRQMTENAAYGVIVSDQLRPNTHTELEDRLQRRQNLLETQTKYYDDAHERISILEAYTAKEIEKILRDTGHQFSFRIVDQDYYERIVATNTPEIRTLEKFEEKIDKAIDETKQAIRSGSTSTVFDMRGALYALAHNIAPNARNSEINAVYEWLQPQEGEIIADVAAGSGFLSKYLHEWTNAPVYAIDPSAQQLHALTKHCPPNVKAILGFPDDPKIIGALPHNLSAITSLGGLHHVKNQRQIFENMAAVTKKGGRFIGVDVCGNTTLSKYFDTCVTTKCLTGHTAQWLDEKKLAHCIDGLPWQMVKTERVPLTMTFDSEYEMYLFFKGLHAYDLHQIEIVQDLKEHLGIVEIHNKLCVQWPLLLFELRKTGNEQV